MLLNLGNYSIKHTTNVSTQGILCKIESCSVIASSVHCRLEQFLAQYGHKCDEQYLEQLSGHVDELNKKTHNIILETFEIEEKIYTSEKHSSELTF